MKKHLLSLPEYTNDVEPLEPYRVKLMQQQEKTANALVQEINHIITNSQITSSILQDIAQLLGVAFQVDCCCIFTSTTDEEKMSVANWCNQQSAEILQSNQRLTKPGILVDLPLVHCGDEALALEDISEIKENLLMGCQCLPLPVQSILAITTRFRNKNNGVINLIKFHNYDWSESEKKLLKAIEPSCAIALAQVSQTQILNHQQQYLQQADRHQDLIKQLTILSLSNLELNQMLQLVISSTAKSLQADRGLVILLKYTDPMFRNRQKQQIPKAKATLVGEWIKNQNTKETSLDNLNQSFWLSDCGLCQRVFMEAEKPIMIDDSTVHKENCPPNSLFNIDDFPNTLLMPFEHQGKVLGFVVLQQQVSRNWQPTELNLVEMVCAQLSNAIIQSQTLRQVQNLVDERTEQLKRSLEVQAKLYERTKQYVAQLQELNELKDEFVSNISDRLRYPLTNMQMSIRNLRLPGISPERQARYLDILESECSKEINLINDLLTLQKLESHEQAPQFESIDLNTKINQLVAIVENSLTEQGLSVNIDLPQQPFTLQTEIESFDRILQELLNNVSKYSEYDTTVYLQATHSIEPELDQVIIKVTNTGRGISQEEAAYIFDKFRRGKGRWTPGTGLGLALVKSLVEHLQGTITVESKPITNSHLSEICFTLTLPQFSSAN